MRIVHVPLGSLLGPLLAAAAFCSSAAACVRAPVEVLPSGPIALAIVTWNMDAGRGDLRQLVADLETGRVTQGQASALVVLLQEAIDDDQNDLRAIAAARGWSMFFVPVRTEVRRSGNAILSNRPLIAPRTIVLPRERQPRAAAAASIEVEGERLFVVSAHLENRTVWWKGGLPSDAARRRQAEALVEALPLNAPGIVGGDFNTWLGRTEPAWRVLAQRFMDTPEPTRAPTFRNRLFLDHLFFDLPVGWEAAERVLGDTYASDHHPVLGIVRRSGERRAALSASWHARGR
jgi:endonuclease/exonuclease/phosphatase family metal-dependent hydrolase